MSLQIKRLNNQRDFVLFHNIILLEVPLELKNEDSKILDFLYVYKIIMNCVLNVYETQVLRIHITYRKLYCYLHIVHLLKPSLI